MNKDRGILLPTPAILIVGLVLAFSPSVHAVPDLPQINTNNVVTVTSYGAVGDGVTVNTAAIQAAIDAATTGGSTNGLIGGRVNFPPGTYMCGPLTMKNGVDLHLNAGAILRLLPLDQYPGGDVSPPNFLTAGSRHDIALSGEGMIDGQGAAWWPGYKTNNRPTLIAWNSCNRQLVQGITITNPPKFNMIISGGGNSIHTTIKGITIRAPGSSPNTDGCGYYGHSFLMQDCDISTGDDNFNAGSGSYDMVLTNNTFGTGHGLSIGSYTENGISNLFVTDCTFNGTGNGLRIKSDRTRGGLVQKITYQNITMINVKFPIHVYAYYLSYWSGSPAAVTPEIAASKPLESINFTPIFRDITFSNITATAASGNPVGMIWAKTELPATNIVFNRVNVTGDRPFALYNVKGATFIDCNFTPSTGNPTFELFNSDCVISNSVPTNKLFTFDGITTNGYLNNLALYNAGGALQNTNAIDGGALALSASTLTISNNFALRPATVVNYTLGTNPALLAVTGNLALDGTNNFFAGPGFTNGNYTVMTYGASLSGSLAATPVTPPGDTYFLDTSVPGLIRLVNNLMIPPNVLATAISTNQINLTWRDVAGETGYRLWRSRTNGGPYVQVGSDLAANVTNYNDTSVLAGTTYYYVVTAFNTNGSSANSPQASATTPGGSGGTLDPALILRWKLDESGGLTTEDATGKGHIGTLVGNPTWVAGQFGSAVNVTGNNWVSTPNADDLQITGQITLAMCVKINSTNSTSFEALISKKDTNYNGPGYELMYRPSGPPEIRVRGGGGTSAKASGANLGTDWQHVAAVIDGSQCLIYVGGQNMTTSTNLNPLSASTNELRIGQNSYGGGGLDGALDGVRIYNRALSQGEIQALLTGDDSGGTPESPALSVGLILGQVVLSWSNMAFKLYNSTNLTPPMVWSLWPGPFTTNGGTVNANIPATEDQSFFRLSWP